MKHLFTLLCLVSLLSCSKDSDNNNNDKDRTLQVVVQDYVPPGTASNYWAVKLIFSPQVTIQGSVKVDFDVYNLGAFYKHYSYTINFDLNNANTFIYQTNVTSAPPGQGWDVKNIVVSNLTQTSGNYNITLK